MKRIFLFFLLIFLWIPLETTAASSTSDVLLINLEKQSHGSLVPGDTFSETFHLKNLTLNPIKVRIRQVSNCENSILFSVVQGTLENSQTLSSLLPLDSLTTDWFSLNSKESLSLPLTLYFPDSCGNAYQNTSLKATFIFEYQFKTDADPYESSAEIPIVISYPAVGSVPMIPSTGDSKIELFFHLVLCSISIFIIIFLNVKKRKQGAFIHEA